MIFMPTLELRMLVAQAGGYCNVELRCYILQNTALPASTMVSEAILHACGSAKVSTDELRLYKFYDVEPSTEQHIEAIYQQVDQGYIGVSDVRRVHGDEPRRC